MSYLMKGKSWQDHHHKLKYPVYVEPKVDEIRLHVLIEPNGAVRYLSYAGKPLHNLGYWDEGMRQLARLLGTRNLDMGVEVNGNFNDSYRWVRSSRGVPAGLLHSQVKFYLFDAPEWQGVYSDRSRALSGAVAHFRDTVCLLPLERHEPALAGTEAAVTAAYERLRDSGYEGAMVKTLDHLYQPGKRIDGWLKLKPEETADGVIVDVLRATSIQGEPLDRVGSALVRVPLDSEGEGWAVACPAGIPHELGRAMWANPVKYIGKWVEFKYMERDRQGGFRHPSFIRFREPKA